MRVGSSWVGVAFMVVAACGGSDRGVAGAGGGTQADAGAPSQPATPAPATPPSGAVQAVGELGVTVLVPTGWKLEAGAGASTWNLQAPAGGSGLASRIQIERGGEGEKPSVEELRKECTKYMKGRVASDGAVEGGGHFVVCEKEVMGRTGSSALVAVPGAGGSAVYCRGASTEAAKFQDVLAVCRSLRAK